MWLNKVARNANYLINKECYLIKSTTKNEKKVYKIAVKSTIMNGSQYWELNKKRKIKMKIAEICMLRWMCAVSKLNTIRGELEKV